ncbi:MBL fold metallo-hydrolase [Maribacter sp. HTCC2170]|uniref:MBL fold metallo-hydrolase n=1 Tax=Maribacter sp. (strain HTCC2170 / KCCM 42371) TaxID=313603 RepID=UPI0005A1C86C|nr:MBL fold metallo-hydrolase [Maribacter sp. HTCC2170]
MLIAIALVIVAVVVVATLFINLSPEFGGKATKEQKEFYSQSSNYKEGKFINIGDVQMNMDFSKFVKSLVGFFSPRPKTTPTSNIDVITVDSLSIAQYKDSTRLVWFGHSTFLLQMKGKNILIDPMFSAVPAPHPMLGGKRFSSELPIEIDQLPQIDAVVLSHDHYDHLDYGSIQRLKNKTNHFFTPLGVGVHLQEWGISEERITELDWWQEISFEDLVFKCAPAQHFSGRGVNDRGNTLWSSWVIQSESESIFFSGDSGYGPHFKEIGDKYGPFDFAMMECGQYNEMWKEIHMMPEETAQAGIDIKAKFIMPIHWGAFKLAMHQWTDPVERLTSKAAELQIPIIVPRIGESIFLQHQKFEANEWWKRYN